MHPLWPAPTAFPESSKTARLCWATCRTGLRRAAVVLAAMLCTLTTRAEAQAGAAWELVGRQGAIYVVVVPAAEAGDRDAYAREVKRLCQPGQSCFINFFTNSTAAPLSLPLPDAVASEATAIFRHSVKQGAEMFRWSCRVAKDPADCF